MLRAQRLELLGGLHLPHQAMRILPGDQGEEVDRGRHRIAAGLTGHRQLVVPDVGLLVEGPGLEGGVWEEELGHNGLPYHTVRTPEALRPSPGAMAPRRVGCPVGTR